ncbi:MAG: hypothetical protein KDA78_18585, partial [Planctomycetaceae bacterium]|nr:hypothetical protein [Planctomycetaceae bacterium]
MPSPFPFFSMDRRSSRRVRSRLTAGPLGLCAEALEDKTLLTVYTVNTTLDEPANGAGVTDGLISLREAINAANSNAAFGDAPAGSGVGTDVINFAPTLNNSVITLGGDQLIISGDLSIVGPGANRLKIDANHQSRIFQINSGVTASISGLTITNGNLNGAGEGDYGGGVINFGTLTLDYVLVSDNTSVGLGGGIANAPGATLTVINSTVSGNTAPGGSGGGIANYGTAKVINSTISGNQSGDYGGGLSNYNNGTLQIINSTITGNQASNTTAVGTLGGGISVGNGTVSLYNTIVAGNTSGTGMAVHDILGTVFSGSQHNLIGDANSSGGLTDDSDFPNNIVGVNGSGTRDINTILNTTLQN